MKKLYLLIGIIFLSSIVIAIPSANNDANLELIIATPVANNAANIEFLEDVPTPPASQCTYSGSGNWLIENTTCNITMNYNLARNNITISNSTVITNASLTNYTNLITKSGTIYTRKTI